MNHVTIIPNVQTKLLEDSRTSFFDFLPAGTTIWTKDLTSVLAFIELHQNKVKEMIDESKSYSSAKIDEVVTANKLNLKSEADIAELIEALNKP